MLLTFSNTVLLFGSMAAGVLTTWFVRNAAGRAGFVSHSNPIVPQHDRPVALLGGGAIGLSLIIVMIATGDIFPMRIVVSTALILFAGVTDDLHPFSPMFKFIVQLIVSVTAVILGISASITDSTLLNGIISVVVIITLINAFNLIDVCDGLLSSLTIIGCVGLAALGAHSGLAFAIAGTILGFLFFNRPDASIFLGDAGSHLLGLLVAILIIDPVYGTISGSFNTWVMIASFLCFGLIVFELVFLIFIRTMKGIPIYQGSPDHFSLIMQSRGFSKWGILGISCAISILLCAVGLIVTSSVSVVRYAVTSIVILSFVLFGRLLVRLESQND